MTYETFLKLIPEMVQSDLGGWANVRLHTIQKNNNVKMEAICILEDGCNVSPAIYLPHYYRRLESGISLEQISREICAEYKSNRCGIYLNVEDFHDYTKMKDRIVYKLIHYGRNRELLEDVPHRRFLDLAVVYYLRIDHHFIGNGTALIHNKQCQIWQVREETLYEQAMLNTDLLLGNRIRPMSQVIRSLLQRDMKQQLAADLCDGICTEEQIENWAEEILEHMISEERYAMYVISNDSMYLGAAAVLNTECMREFAGEINSSLYVIPSSIHEMILIPKAEGIGSGDLKRLLQEVNESEENIQDFLSDRVYYFDQENGWNIMDEVQHRDSKEENSF